MPYLFNFFFFFYEYLLLQVVSVAFVPSHLVALLTLGLNTGLVLDIGFSEASVIPVYEGVPILSAWQSLHLGTKALQR